MKDTEAKARTAIAPLREGLREFYFTRLAKASSELVRSEVLESSHGIGLSKTVGFLRHVFLETSRSGNASTRLIGKFPVQAFGPVRCGSVTPRR